MAMMEANSKSPTSEDECEEAREEQELVVSTPYIEHWNDLIDLWFLGMQVLSNVLQQVPWVIDFIVDSGWAQEIVRYSLMATLSGSSQP